MKMTLSTVGLLALVSGAAMAETVGVSIVNFDDRFQTLLRNGMSDYAATLDGVELQIEDAQNDMGKQLDQINNFIASGVDAIIVTAVDTSAAQALSDAAAAAGIPLVYVNLQPDNLDTLPDNQAFVGSNEIESGTLGAFEACRLLRAQGKGNGAQGYVLIGDLAHSAAVQRTKDVHDIVGTDMCNFITITDEQTGNWQREDAQNLMSNWLSGDEAPDVVFANNDEMAIGAIQGLKAAGVSMEDVVVVGVDATQDALAAMQAGELDVTVFQNAAAQGQGALDTALALARGEEVDSPVYIPFELVTPETIDAYMTAN